MKQLDFELNPQKTVEFDIISSLKNFVDDHSSFYHINVYGDKITVEEQGYNTSAIKKIVFDTKKLKNGIITKQIRDAIVSIYQYVFYKNGELGSRISTILENPCADSHWGASHTFYHDRTGKYPEHMIVKRIMNLNEEKSLEENFQINKFHK